MWKQWKAVIYVKNKIENLFILLLNFQLASGLVSHAYFALSDIGSFGGQFWGLIARLAIIHLFPIFK